MTTSAKTHSSDTVSATTRLKAAALLSLKSETGLTAHAGGTQAAGLALSATVCVHHVTVCATAADSVLLPVLVVDDVHIVFNFGAASMQIYGAGTSTINDVATATGVAIPAGKGAIFHARETGKWYMVLGA